MDKARLYSNENFPRRVVGKLRALGHDVLTSRDAGCANKRVPDDEVLEFATAEKRAVLTLNRRDFIKLHRKTKAAHGGIVICTVDSDSAQQAERIHAALAGVETLAGGLVRVNRPNSPKSRARK